MNKENKVLYTTEINKEIEDIIYNSKETDGMLTIIFGEENIKLSYYHSQDCCENVYADFEVINDYKCRIIGRIFDNFIIKGIEGMGFLLCFEREYADSKEKVFIPCYNEQNGYYSDDLQLIIKKNNNEIKINISDLTEYID